MKLSVLINVYNAEDDLPELLDSLLKQSFQDFELVIADDGSTDHTVPVIQAYSRRFHDLKLIRLSHVGMVRARKRAFDGMTGDICVVLDADETLAGEDVLNRFLEPFAAPEVAGVGGRKIPLDRGDWITDGYRVIKEAHFWSRMGADGSIQYLPGGAMALRAEAVRQVGGMSDNQYLVDDVDISSRLRAAGWTLLGSSDIRITHREPGTLIGILKHGYRYKAYRETFLTYPREFLTWQMWSRFFPLIVLIILPFAPVLSLLLLTLSLGTAFWVFRGVPGSCLSKIKAWVIRLIWGTGWSAGFVTGVIEHAAHRVWR